MIVVADSGPIIALARVGALDLLPRLYTRVVVPGAVWDEVVVAGAGLPGSSELANAPWVDCVRSPLAGPLATSLRGELDPGEAEALVLAVELGAELLLLDDRRWRDAAVRLGLRIRGTVGVLVEARRAGLLPAIAPSLSDLAASGFRLSPEVRREAMELAGEWDGGT